MQFRAPAFDQCGEDFFGAGIDCIGDVAGNVARQLGEIVVIAQQVCKLAGALFRVCRMCAFRIMEDIQRIRQLLHLIAPFMRRFRRFLARRRG